MANEYDKQLVYNSFIWTKVNSIQYEHDIMVYNIQSPTPTEVNHTTYVSATIRNKGLNDEVNVSINFTVNGAVGQN